MFIPRILFLLIILSFTAVAQADPAFFEQKAYIREQNQPYTTPYQEAVKNTNEIQVQEQEAKQAPPSDNLAPMQEEEEPSEDEEP